MFIKRCLLGFYSVVLMLNAVQAETVPTESIEELSGKDASLVVIEPESDGLISEISGEDVSSWLGLQPYGVVMGGWAAGGYNYNTENPQQGNNGPVSMTDQSGAVNLYQMDFFIEKAIAKGVAWDIGGRFDYMFGTDTRYTQAAGNWDASLMSKNNYYNMAMPQAYAEIFAPIGHGLSAKLGHFYTIIGYESVPSGPNFFSSHSYSFKSSPFTTTGALFNYAINQEWGLNFGAVTGPDNFISQSGAWSQMSGLTWNNVRTGTTAIFSIMSGNVYEDKSSEQVYYSAILQQAFGKWTYVLEHDRGTQQNAISQGQTAEWYSIVNYLTYQTTETTGLGVRGEWFNDVNGFRYDKGAANFYQVTVGLNWKPKHWLMIRPEVRYDWSQAQIAAFDNGQRSDQILLGFDTLIQF